MRIKIVQKIIDKIRGKKVLYPNINTNTFYNNLCYAFIPAMNTHPVTFSKYKNIYKNQDIVLVASGPTLEYYTNINGAIHIGVNHTFLKQSFNLDYLFVQDYLREQQEAANKYRGDKCTKIYGCHYCQGGLREKDFDEASAERYYFINQHEKLEYIAISNADITKRPLNVWGSVIFAAMEFALWTHPKRIYLVGCDACANGHYYYKNVSPDITYPKINIVFEGWKIIKEFIDHHYPDVEIISVNPVALKGLFKDVYTKEYIASMDKNSNCENFEILNI